MIDILGHRGASAAHPENTLRALLAAVDPDEGGAEGVELDVQLDGGGRPMVFHDHDTERLTGVAGVFGAHLPAQLAQLRVEGQQIPTLSGALEALVDAATSQSRRLVVNVELKSNAAIGVLLDACQPVLQPYAAHPLVELIVSSFDPRVILGARRRGLPWRLAYIFDDARAMTVIAHLASLGPLDLHPRHDLVDDAFTEEYGAEGRTFRCWTVDTAVEVRRLMDHGVGAIITNRPGALRAELSERT